MGWPVRSTVRTAEATRRRVDQHPQRAQLAGGTHRGLHRLLLGHIALHEQPGNLGGRLGPLVRLDVEDDAMGAQASQPGVRRPVRSPTHRR